LIIVRWQNVTDTVEYWTEVCLCGDAVGEKPIRKTGRFCSTHIMKPVPHCNAEMEQVFGQINIVKLKLNNRMSAELVIMQFEYQDVIEK